MENRLHINKLRKYCYDTMIRFNDNSITTHGGFDIEFYETLITKMKILDIINDNKTKTSIIELCEKGINNELENIILYSNHSDSIKLKIITITKEKIKLYSNVINELNSIN